MNDGFINEKELISYINNNNWINYNNNIKDFLKFIFKNYFVEKLKFIAEKCEGQIKPDLVIIHNNKKKYISVKKGSGNSVHQEKTVIFFPYIEKKFNKIILNNLKLFHYGDDTLDDTGITRYSAKECQNKYEKEIFDLNKHFNEAENLKLFLDRFLFSGNVNQDLSTDFIYHGNFQKGLWASREEIINYFCLNKFYSAAVHFGSLTYQVWGRDNKFTAIHPDRRYVMQIKWGSIGKDIDSIRKINDNVHRNI